MTMSNHYLTGLTMLVLGSSLFSCKDDSAGSRGYQLPTVVGVSSCGERPEGLDLCTWAHSADLVIHGTVGSVEGQYQQAVVANNEAEITDDCEGTVFPSLKIRMSSFEVIHNSKAEYSKINDVVFYVGAWHARKLNPRPYFGTDGGLGWVSLDGSEANDLGILPGQEIGFALHYSTLDGVWSVLDELMFTYDRDEERLKFQKVFDNCIEAPPADRGDTDLEEVASEISSCGLDAREKAALRKDNKEKFLFTRADYYKSPECSPTDEPGGTGCTIDMECSGHSVCDNGRCVPAD